MHGDQHKLSMSLLRVEQAKATNHPVTAYASFAQSLLFMDRLLRERMGKKFDICYMLAKENLPFHKYPAIHELESHQGVDLWQSYPLKIPPDSCSVLVSKYVMSCYHSVNGYYVVELEVFALRLQLPKTFFEMAEKSQSMAEQICSWSDICQTKRIFFLLHTVYTFTLIATLVWSLLNLVPRLFIKNGLATYLLTSAAESV